MIPATSFGSIVRRDATRTCATLESGERTTIVGWLHASLALHDRGRMPPKLFAGLNAPVNCFILDRLKG